MKKFLLTAAALAFAAGAFAQAAPAAPAAAPAAKAMHKSEAFKNIDTNGDGQISRDEAKGHPMLEKNFDAIDTNKDGQLSKAELKAFRKAKHAAKMAGKTVATPAAPAAKP